MPNTVASNPSRSGQTNGAGSDLALFLKKFAGEVLTTFTTENIFSQMHTMRTIENGKSAQFPLTGIAQAAYHTPGYDILDNSNGLLSNVLHDEKVINIDSLLLSSVFVPNIDEMMNHYDVRSIYSTELGRALAKKFDQNIAKVIALGAAGTSAVTSGAKVSSVSITSKGTYSLAPTTVTFSAPPSGTTATGTVVMSSLNLVGITVTNPGTGYVTAPTITISGGTGTQGTATCTVVNDRAGSTVTLANSTGVEPTGTQIVDGLYAAAQNLDEKNIPSQDRYCVLNPNEYYKVARSSTDLFNRFFGNTGNLASVELPEVAGFMIARSNNLPRFGQAAVTGENNTYSGDFSSLRALCFHKAAAGTVKLRDIAVESEYQIARQGTLFVSKYAMGHGSLRPEAAVVVNRTA